MGQRQGETGRLAITCWDYAWPLGPAYGAVPGAVEARLDDVVARGFNAVRLDPYPHLLATPANSVHLDHCEILAEPDRRRGLPGGAVTVPIRKAFRRLLDAAAERDLKLWLSGFFLPDSRARRSFVRRPGDFVDVWVETLDLIRQWGHLDTVVAVDFCHHFPFPPWSHGPVRRLFGQSGQRPLPERWSRDQEAGVERYLLEVPRALRAHFPEIRFGLSAAVADSEHLRQLDTSELDFLDLGLWLDDDPRFRLATGADLPVPGVLGRRLAGPLRGALLDVSGDHWRGRLQEQLNRRLAFARVRRLQPVLGEGWLTSPGDPGRLPRRWAGFTETVVAQAVAGGVGALTPTSLAAPHNDWLWREADWLAHLNHLILTGPGR
ncbi:cellulase-like family protein [Alloalcanivorax sp. C16-2]|uniref:cellulase-like family protein n=1 Tax=Alloalcanivorax sp. C16-2 TaxID=3390052 RepID=UPI003970FED9